MGWLSNRRRRERWQADQAAFEAARAAGECVLARQGAIRDLVAERFPFAGFERVRDNRWVAPQPREGEFRVVEVSAYKGMAYGLQWGVSLPYLPDDRGRRHRTLKAAQLDLLERGERVARYWFAEDRTEPLVWYVTPEIDALVAEAELRAPAFWERTATPAGVVDEALAQISGTEWKWRQDEIVRLAARECNERGSETTL